MRAVRMAVAAFLILVTGATADEADVANAHTANGGPEVEAVYPAQYPLRWQRRLLAAQLAFAATLQKTDPVETGSVTHQTQ